MAEDPLPRRHRSRRAQRIKRDLGPPQFAVGDMQRLDSERKGTLAASVMPGSTLMAGCYNMRSTMSASMRRIRRDLSNVSTGAAHCRRALAGVGTRSDRLRTHAAATSSPEICNICGQSATAHDARGCSAGSVPPSVPRQGAVRPATRPAAGR